MKYPQRLWFIILELKSLQPTRSVEMISSISVDCNNSFNLDSKSGSAGTNPADDPASNLEQDTLFHDEYSVRIIGQVLIFLLAVPLNSIVIYTFLGNNSQQTRVSCLVGHLCAINLAYALFSIPFDVIWHITGKFAINFYNKVQKQPRFLERFLQILAEK